MDTGCPVGGDCGPEHVPLSRRFESWKEIAAYFGRDVRTVRRWERNEALPVHRHLHRSRGSIYAFQNELDLWLARRSAPAGTPVRVPAADAYRRLRGMLLLLGVPIVLGITGWAVLLTGRVDVSRIPGDTAMAHALGVKPRRWLADPGVRKDFLLARHHLQRRTGYLEQAREYLEATIRRAPDFAEAHALLGEAYVRQALFDRSRRSESWPKAEAAAKHALALDGDLSTAHTVLSRILLLRDWNLPAAAAESLRAIELDPDAPDARSAYALCLRSAGRVADAVVERERAQRVDPLNPQWLIFLGDEYTFARRYDVALQAYQRALELERDYRPAVVSLADVYARLDRYTDAAAWQLRALTLGGQKDVAAAFEGVLQRDGPQAAMRWLDRWNIAKFQRRPDEHLWDLAYLHARLGNREEALRFLQRACDERQAGMLQARVDPDLDSLRGDPRFDDLIRRIAPD